MNHIDGTEEYKVGGPRPSGFLSVFEWADVQIKGGLRQERCASCDLYKFPQERCEKFVKSKFK